MANSERHARAFDLPGWPCPPRVRDIPHREESWGRVHIGTSDAGAVAQDELGYLWANGAAVPQFALPNDALANPGAILCWTENGLGVWVHPSSLASIPSLSRLDIEPDKWIPIAVVLSELPAFVKAGHSAS